MLRASNKGVCLVLIIAFLCTSILLSACEDTSASFVNIMTVIINIVSVTLYFLRIARQINARGNSSYCIIEYRR